MNRNFTTTTLCQVKYRNMAHRAAVFSSYRRLYRARIALFRNDVEAMTKSRDAVRVEYLKHGTDHITDGQHFQSLLGMADEAADMLRHSIIQGRLNSNTGHYGTFNVESFLF